MSPTKKTPAKLAGKARARWEENDRVIRRISDSLDVAQADLTKLGGNLGAGAGDLRRDLARRPARTSNGCSGTSWPPPSRRRVLPEKPKPRPPRNPKRARPPKRKPARPRKRKPGPLRKPNLARPRNRKPAPPRNRKPAPPANRAPRAPAGSAYTHQAGAQRARRGHRPEQAGPSPRAQ